MAPDWRAKSGMDRGDGRNDLCGTTAGGSSRPQPNVLEAALAPETTVDGIGTPLAPRGVGSRRDLRQTLLADARHAEPRNISNLA